jgi:uncharacterized protein (DUF1499 family)
MSFLKKSKHIWFWLLPVLVGLAWLVMRLMVQIVSPTPVGIGVQNGRLAACPESPNCVSTFAATPLHAMSPWPLTGDAAAAQTRLLTLIQEQPHTRIITNIPNYLHVEFRSLVWGFVDDVEFYLDEPAGLIHFRSAARLGHRDMGVNRTRMEQLAAAWAAVSSQQ